MSKNNRPKGISPEDYAAAFKALKSGPRWELLRSVKTRLQQAWEYLRSPTTTTNPFRLKLQVIEILMMSPLLKEERIGELVLALRGELLPGEAEILAVPPQVTSGSLCPNNGGEG